MAESLVEAACRNLYPSLPYVDQLRFYPLLVPVYLVALALLSFALPPNSRNCNPHLSIVNLYLLK
jgi:hypothetical protein